MSAVHYRPADLADVPTLARLREEGEAGGADEDRMRGYLSGERQPQHALRPRAMWLAAESDRSIGYVAGHLTRRYACDGELQWIYVVRDHRRTGVASELLRLLSAWFAEHGARRICVDVGDDRARSFYRRHGAVHLNAHWMVWDDLSAAISDPPLK